MNTNCRLRAAGLLACVLTLSSAAASGATAALPLDAYKAQVCTDSIEIMRTACRIRVDEADRKLNAAYREATSVAPRVRELRAQQRRWLVEVRDRCTTDTCARQAMAARVLELQEIALRALGRREAPMTAREQRQICEGIAGLSSRGEIADRLLPFQDLPQVSLSEVKGRRSEPPRSAYGGPQQVFSLPIRRDVDFVFGNFFTGGSCFSSEIRAISDPLYRPQESWPSEEIDNDEADDVIRWGTWGGGESILMFGGRHFIVTTGAPKYTVGIVTWITPIGTRRPLCVLEVSRTERTATFIREDAALCSASVRDELRPLAWKRAELADFVYDETQKANLRDHSVLAAGMSAFEMLETEIDGNNDGIPERFARANRTSGAGCGWSDSRLYRMSPDGKQLRLGPGADFRTINAAPVEVYSFKDSTYVLAALNGNPALFKLLQDSVDTECVFHDQPISRVKTLYPLDGPVRDPAKRRD